ncbi:MAG TPA: tRNA (adenosine(37)-N6)-threonylcarbamoyltransferase complex ATPase subunit type 1 TsaE [Candidatus Binatia bacterium]|jgi:tRNA threonylcarbamoyladenosine biosynthesis protein TsaE|nr:tRNA (adenosine(37)-N6)-threonylcarbamoyltransferase complex ATPase subunit type 1 TsaE [Candidatus Binatia bacterium]
MATHISHSPAETEALGEGWGPSAQPGLVIGLCGDLGAGKTQFVKGLARGLGITARVHSPTFTLVNVYAGGRLTLFHLDLYRLETPEQILAAGLEEYLRPDGITVIEWAERWFDFQSPASNAATSQSPVPGGQGIGPPRMQSAATIHHPSSIRHPPSSAPPLMLWVRIETLSETERRINYEDTRA